MHPSSESTLWEMVPSENCSKHSLSHRQPGWTFHLERTGTQGQLILSCWKEQVTLNLVIPTGLNPSYAATDKATKAIYSVKTLKISG